MDSWIAIFKTGKHIDSAGTERDWNEGDLDEIVSQYNPAEHEAPVVIGHPTDNAPAYGWVEGLKREGQTLFAKFKNLVPEFVDMVRRGLFKKRSIALYPDLMLRHVGFLGAMPPAVKGLPDVGFKHGQVATVIEFEDEQEKIIQTAVERMCDAIARGWGFVSGEEEKKVNSAPEGPLARRAYAPEGKNQQGGQTMTVKNKLMSIFSKGLEGLPEDDPLLQPDEPRTFTEAELKAKADEAAEKARKEEKERIEKEFAEKEKAKVIETRKAEIKTWCDQMVKDGKLVPAIVKYGVPELMEHLAASADEIEFGEEKTKAAPYDRFKGLFETVLPKLINFGEVATRDSDTGDQGNAGAKLESLIQKKRGENKDLTYAQAFAEVQKENPDLATEYAKEARGQA